MMKIQKQLGKTLYLLLILAGIGIGGVIVSLVTPPPGTPDAGNQYAETTVPVESKPATPTDAGKTEPPSEAEISGPGETIPAPPNDTWWQEYLSVPVPEGTDSGEAELPDNSAAADNAAVSDEPPVLMLTADLHYYSSELTDYGQAFKDQIARDDGKMTWYSDEMIDALLEEALQIRPTVLILAGDITSFGEKENHLRLAEKLQTVQAQGVQVLVIPGNHDINSSGKGGLYYGDEVVWAESVTAAEFAEIYQAFGYEQALRRDQYSLSYIYPLDDRHWAMMLDTCQYDPVNLDNGRLLTETLEWVGRQLEDARAGGIQVVPVGHHNLLKESRMFPTGCTIENHEELTWLLQQYQLPVYFSGHLHVRRVKCYQEEPGIPADVRRLYEIVLPPYSLPGCGYGLLTWDEAERMEYHTQAVSISQWAGRHDTEDENLRQFDELAPIWLKQIIKGQVKKKLYSLPEEQVEAMAALYADIYYAYVRGEQLDFNQVDQTEAWLLWERLAPEHDYFMQMQKMIRDNRNSHLQWEYSLAP